jgi:hypothetical protein
MFWNLQVPNGISKTFLLPAQVYWSVQARMSSYCIMEEEGGVGS